MEPSNSSGKINVFRSMFAKIIVLTILASVILFGVSYYILNYSLRQLQAEITGSRLHSDIQYVRDLIGKGDWNKRDGALYHGDVLIGDGTPENANIAPFLEGEEKTGTFSYTFVSCSDEGLTWVGDKNTGYQQGHFLRAAGSTLGPNGESIVGTYMDKLVADVLDDNGIYQGWANVAGRQIYCIYETLEDANGQVVGAIVVGRGIEELNAQLQDSTGKFVVVYLLVLTILIAIVVVMVAQWTASINRIVSYLERITAGRFPGKPLKVKTRDEMEFVAESINHMLDSLKEKELLSGYHEGVLKNSLINFTVNVTQLEYENPGEVFVDRPDIMSAPFKEKGRLLIKRILYEDDQIKLLPLIDPDILSNQMEEDPEFEIFVRVDPRRLFEYFKSDGKEAFLKKHAGHNLVWICFHGVLLYGANSELFMYVDISDAHEKMRDAEKVKQKAEIDPLTNLYNRGKFKEEIEKIMRTRDAKGALFMLDLDNFKEVNDNFGHPKGDETLEKVADNFRRLFRQGDLLCRLGGDEFCAFANNFVDEELLRKRAESILKENEMEYSTGDGNKITISASVGIAIFPDDATGYEELYEKADKALYLAKQEGKNCYRFSNQ